MLILKSKLKYTMKSDNLFKINKYSLLKLIGFELFIGYFFLVVLNRVHAGDFAASPLKQQAFPAVYVMTTWWHMTLMRGVFYLSQHSDTEANIIGCYCRYVFYCHAISYESFRKYSSNCSSAIKKNQQLKNEGTSILYTAEIIFKIYFS